MDQHLSVSELKKQVTQFKNIIRNIPGCIYWKNKKGVYLGCNRAFLDMVGLASEEDVIGKVDEDLCWKNQAKVLHEHDLLVMQSGCTKVLEEKVALADGSNALYSVIKSPLYNEENEVIGVVGTSMDITYRKEMEDQLKETIQKLETANRVKAEFISNMEHDIRTPFCGVLGLANQLYQKETDPLKKERLADITDCARELLDYCNNILNYSKIELGSLAFLEKKFNVKELVESIITIETPPAKLNNLALTVDYDLSMPLILIGDAYRLQKILINLISNAVKFTKEGYVRLVVKLLSKVSDNRNVIVTFIVEDTGIGIPQDKQDFIYEKFSRLNRSNQGIYKGIGLGLTIVKQFVNEMNGEIDLKSETCKGSTFMCTFPFKLPLSDEAL